AAPIHRAIEAGDAETGVTIMQMDAGLDTGDMLLMERLAIAPTDTTATLHDRLAALGGRMIVEALELAACGGLKAVPQPAEGITYAHKIEKAESTIDWSLPATVIGQRIRAFDPFPGASTECAGETIKVWSYEIDSDKSNTDKRQGQILSVNGDGVTVACGEGTLRLTTLQRAGGKRLAAADFLRGFDLQPGMVLGAAPTTAATPE
ncbi:MAG: methionyl-tRNA formyltransferase, partial [Acidovorax sp.]|nr:methionyl-tRNA formyltransferase [Acidovorax sp.]